jgi:type II secretory pathway component PulF
MRFYASHPLSEQEGTRPVSLYKYQARDRIGNLVNGQADAEDISILKTVLKERGLWVVKAKPARTSVVKFTMRPSPAIKLLELLMFTKQMGVMLNAGVALVTALTQIQTHASAQFRPVLAKIIEDIKNGLSYAEALSAYPRIFSPFFVGMIEVGEAGGLLAEMHRKLTLHIQQSMDLKRKMLFASIYPGFVLIATIFGITTILVYAFPKIADIYNSHNVQLPFISRLMLGISGFLTHQWYIPLAAIVIILFLILGLRLHTHPGVKRVIDRLVFRIPFYNEFFRQMILSRFTLNLSLLLNSGVPIIRALNIIKILIGNSLVQTDITAMIRSVQDGEGMSAYMQTNSLFPSLLVSMVQTGETSGELVRMMEDASNYFGEEVEAGMKKFVAVIEPLLIVFAAASVFLVLLAFYLPMFQMFKVFSNR